MLEGASIKLSGAVKNINGKSVSAFLQHPLDEKTLNEYRRCTHKHRSGKT